jgi:hypothetical protein
MGSTAISRAMALLREDVILYSLYKRSSQLKIFKYRLWFRRINHQQDVKNLEMIDDQ